MTANDIEAVLLQTLDARAPEATVCPSEVARSIAGHDEAAWRALMPAVRAAAARLAAAGRVVVTRRGECVDAESTGGPIRIGRPR
jgi:hypothetical protein